MGKVLKVIRSDNEFVTPAVTEWLQDHPDILILPSIAYEYDTIKKVERAIQTIDNSIIKMLDLPRSSPLQTTLGNGVYSCV